MDGGSGRRLGRLDHPEEQQRAEQEPGEHDQAVQEQQAPVATCGARAQRRVVTRTTTATAGNAQRIGAASLLLARQDGQAPGANAWPSPEKRRENSS